MKRLPHLLLIQCNSLRSWKQAGKHLLTVKNDRNISIEQQINNCCFLWNYLMPSVKWTCADVLEINGQRNIVISCRFSNIAKHKKHFVKKYLDSQPRTWTKLWSRFYTVVQLHKLCKVGYSLCSLAANFLQYMSAKNYENQSTYIKNINEDKVSPFWGTA